jgi:diguanylate cyclase (GGDEF)-like protein
METEQTPAVRGRGDPPRLVLRFAIATGIALALAAGGILLVVRHYNTVQAERGAAAQARVIAGTVLRGNLLSSDFDRLVADGRRSSLDGLIQEHVLTGGVLLVELYSPTGVVTYSSDHRVIGTQTSAPVGHLREAAAGTIRSDVTRIRAGPDRAKALRTYAPVAVPGGSGVVAIFQDYGPIAQAASATFLPVVGIFEAALLLLFFALVPILRRVTTRLRRQMEEIERRAYYDELTGLPNRTLYRDRIEEAILAAHRDGGRATLMLLDVDRFKEVNDALGHDTGDLLLQELARRLRMSLRTDETLARLGGDEFGILLPGASVEEAMVCASRIHAAFKSPFTLRGLALEVRTSIGIASYPDHGEDIDTLIQHADVAMYVAKDNRAGTSTYDAEEDENDAARLALAGELRRAIEQDELVLHFQPISDLETGRIVGAEALVRWEHPERGFIQPTDFIPLAERMGLLNPLSRHVVESSLRQCAVWNASGVALRVSVNLSIPDLLDLELPDWIAELLAECSVRPEQLELEITESTILADPFRVRHVLNRLNDLGLRLAIDDFGTGYSSLAYLKRLPVQTIKIDRSFVMEMCADPSDATIVRSTIDLGRNLGLDIVAEGVQSQEIWDALRGLGCTLAQGFLIGRPMPAADFTALIRRRAA